MSRTAVFYLLYLLMNAFSISFFAENFQEISRGSITLDLGPKKSVENVNLLYQIYFPRYGQVSSGSKNEKKS